MALMELATFKKMATEIIHTTMSRAKDAVTIEAIEQLSRDLFKCGDTMCMSWYLDIYKTNKHGEHYYECVMLARELYKLLGMEHLYSMFPVAIGGVNYRIVSVSCDINGNYVRRVQFFGVDKADSRKLFKNATKEVAEVLGLRYNKKNQYCLVYNDDVNREISWLSRMLYETSDALAPIEHSF
jgi:hypothetical protein